MGTVRSGAVRRALATCAAAVSLAPASAAANMGIGFLIPAVPFIVVAIVPAVLVEAPMLARFMGVALKRGLWLSLCANLVSTVLGSVVAVALDLALAAGTGSSGGDPNRAVVLIALVPMFFITWWLERWIVRRMQNGDPRAGRATFFANVVSYALLAVAVAIVVPAQGSGSVRIRVSKALAALTIARSQAQEAFEATGRFPPSVAVEPSPNLRGVAIDASGRIVGTLAMPGVPEVDGRTIVLAPRVEGHAITAWSCRAPDVPSRFLPPSCR